MNPYDWISLFYIVAKDGKKYEPIFGYLRRMIKSYILEIAKIDVGIAYVLKKRPILNQFDQPEDIQHLKGGFFDKEHWSSVFKMKEEANSSNSAGDVKCVSDMIRRYIAVRTSLLKI
ncbi:unnamed protein product [Lactuca saligna]|uniref:Uncharacterized protein n=1 Tax=Lactuca saligna TaxID=75948 RepID=A0AA36A0R4_LACSI|nr:unnamed protein product [Lactuca saligna]